MNPIRLQIFLGGTVIMVIACMPLWVAGQSTNNTASNLNQASEATVDKPLGTPSIVVYAGVNAQGKNFRIGVSGWTNLVAYKPLKSQLYEAKLFDSSGKSISQTLWARWNIGQKLVPDKKLIDGSYRNDPAEFFGHSRKFVFGPVKGEVGDEVGGEWPPILLEENDVLRLFRINNPGEYTLQVQVRLFTKDTNGTFQPFVLPPAETKVKINDEDLSHSFHW